MATPSNIYHTLDNGLRVVHRHSDSPVEYCGLAVRAGSRNEAPDEYGVAHFVEHTIFKGTSRRKSWHIINRMESVGGELNAYTSEEVTMVYSAFPKGNAERCIELISDLVANSRFPLNEIDKEREVVLDEVASYLDTPADAIFDEFNDLIFAESSLGHNILGTEKTISSFTPEICRDFLSRYYTPGNMVLFYMGPMSDNRFIKLAEKHLGALDHLSNITTPTPPAEVKPFNISRRLDTHQSHTVVGTRIPGMYDDSRHAYALLTNIIGGPCMNSLLNIALRERHGYVYSVDAYSSMFTDCGLFTVYFGCDDNHVKRCLKLIFETFDRLASTPLNPKALQASKKQYLGQTIVAGENREQLALSIGRATLFYGHAISANEVIERINSISAEELRSAAERLRPELCSTLTFS